MWLDLSPTYQTPFLSTVPVLYPVERRKQTGHYLQITYCKADDTTHLFFFPLSSPISSVESLSGLLSVKDILTRPQRVGISFDKQNLALFGGGGRGATLVISIPRFLLDFPFRPAISLFSYTYTSLPFTRPLVNVTKTFGPPLRFSEEQGQKGSTTIRISIFLAADLAEPTAKSRSWSSPFRQSLPVPGLV